MLALHSQESGYCKQQNIPLAMHRVTYTLYVFPNSNTCRPTSFQLVLLFHIFIWNSRVHFSGISKIFRDMVTKIFLCISISSTFLYASQLGNTYMYSWKPLTWILNARVAYLSQIFCLAPLCFVDVTIQAVTLEWKNAGIVFEILT